MEMCDLGENSPPFVSMPLAAMRKAVDYLSGERKNNICMSIAVATGHVLRCTRLFGNTAHHLVDTTAITSRSAI